MKRPLLVLLLAAAACGSGNRPGGHSDRPQVVFLGVDGARDARVDERVAELVERRFDIIGKDAYMDRARELGAEKITRKNLAKVTSSLGAVALVHGSARGKSAKKQSVTIYVREPKKGKIKERYKLSVRKGVLAKKSDRALARQLLASVKVPKKKKEKKEEPPPEVEEPPDDEPEAVAEKEEAKEEKQEKDERDEKPAKVEKKKTTKKQADEEADEDDDPDPAPKVEYDGAGQAIDDEVPPM